MDSVFYALILCKIRYALCAWGGHITEANKGQINAFLRRMHRYGYVSAVYNIDDLICAADAKLFSSMCKVHHCVNYLLLEVKTSDYSLRKRIKILNYFFGTTVYLGTHLSFAVFSNSSEHFLVVNSCNVILSIFACTFVMF